MVNCSLAAGDCDVFLTVDAGIEYQQDLGLVALGAVFPFSLKDIAARPVRTLPVSFSGCGW
jgi:hypothetical protein